MTSRKRCTKLTTTLVAPQTFAAKLGPAHKGKAAGGSMTSREMDDATGHRRGGQAHDPHLNRSLATKRVLSKQFTEFLGMSVVSQTEKVLVTS